jgi:hypothetical protein
MISFRLRPIFEQRSRRHETWHKPRPIFERQTRPHDNDRKPRSISTQQSGLWEMRRALRPVPNRLQLLHLHLV